jgi:hypothetical protein
VSGIALDVLDELRIRMMECRLVLQALTNEADLNFDELDHELLAVLESARLAYEAASLVHQRARLATRWGTGWSRPKAIFARHSAEVHSGAHRVTPKPALSDRLERSLWRLPSPLRARDTPGARPRCAGTVRTTGVRCTASAIYLGSGTFGAQCYSHASPHERDQYRAHNDAITTAHTGAYDTLLNNRHDVGESITVQWLQHREGRQQWVDEIARVSESTA